MLPPRTLLAPLAWPLPKHPFGRDAETCLLSLLLFLSLLFSLSLLIINPSRDAFAATQVRQANVSFPAGGQQLNRDDGTGSFLGTPGPQTSEEANKYNRQYGLQMA